MRTPAGTECKFYYEDFFRGRGVQECRLAKSNPESSRWHQQDCFKCPVPAILNANASPDLELTLTIRSRILGLVRKMTVTAHCAKHNILVQDAYTGCPRCNADRPGLDLFRRALEQNDDTGNG